MTVDMQGTPAASQASATGLIVSGVEIDQHHVDLVGIDQRLRQLSGARGIGLGVAIEDFDAIGLVADLEPGGQRLASEFENIAVGLAEPAKLAGARADEADLERRLGPRGESAIRAGGGREAAALADTISPRRDIGRPPRVDDGGSGFHVFPPCRRPLRGARHPFLHTIAGNRPAPPADWPWIFAIPSLSIFFHRLTGLSAGRLFARFLCGDFAGLNADQVMDFQDSMTEPREN